MIREFILQMKLGRVKSEYFHQKFGIDILERFAAPLAQIQSEGLLTIENSTILLTRDGLLCVDNLLHDFFLPHHHTDKIV
jgi:oxygen-independent coproporphyrinogen-3 oxidase